MSDCLNVVIMEKSLEDICNEVSEIESQFDLLKNNGIKIFVIVKSSEVNSFDRLYLWRNPQLKRYSKIKYKREQGKWQNIPTPKELPITGEQLAKAMLSMQERYDVEFLFCRPDEAGAEIVRLLTEGIDE